MTTMLANRPASERQLTLEELLPDFAVATESPSHIRQIEHPADAEVRAFRTIRERVEPRLNRERELDDAVERFTDLVEAVLNHEDHHDGGNVQMSTLAAEHGFTAHRAVRLLTALEVRLAQSAKASYGPLDVRVHNEIRLDLGGTEADVYVPGGLNNDDQQKVGALILRLSGSDDVRDVVKRFVGRGLVNDLVDDGTVQTVVGLTADFLLRLHTRLTVGHLDRLPKLVEHPSGNVNVELGYQLVRGWRHLDESRRRAVEAHQRLVDQADRPTPELLNDVKRATWLRPQETRRLVALDRDVDDDQTVRKAIGFYRQRIIRARQKARSQWVTEGRHVSSEYEPMCVAHLSVAQVQHLLRLVGAEPDYSTVAEEATAIAEAYAGQIGADDDQVGHRITTALLVTGARDVLADCLQRRDTHTDWDAPLRAHLRNAMPRPF